MIPNWRQFAAIAFNPTVAAVIKALAIEVPPEGRPTSFACHDGFMAARTTEGKWVVHDRGGSRFVESPQDVGTHTHTHAHTSAFTHIHAPTHTLLVEKSSAAASSASAGVRHPHLYQAAAGQPGGGGGPCWC